MRFWHNRGSGFEFTASTEPDSFCTLEQWPVGTSCVKHGLQRRKTARGSTHPHHTLPCTHINTPREVAPDGEWPHHEGDWGSDDSEVVFLVLPRRSPTLTNLLEMSRK